MNSSATACVGRDFRVLGFSQVERFGILYMNSSAPLSQPESRRNGESKKKRV